MTMMILSAAKFANQSHLGQFRKYTGRPYIEHPLRVAGMASLLADSTEECVAAAWLHDVVEDCDVRHGEIGDRFGQLVQSLVCELTNPSKGSKQPRSARKAMDRDHIALASLAARKLKALDRLDNLRDMGQCDKPDFLRLYVAESRGLADALLIRPGDDELRDLVNELVRAVEALRGGGE